MVSPNKSNIKKSAELIQITKRYLKKPEWLKIKVPSGDGFKEVFKILKSHHLSTVCKEARCPNINDCWNRRQATIMILGKVCTRACRFCAVKTGNPGGVLNPEEPENVAEAVKELKLRYVVLTSVDRDDLPDHGSGHYARTIKSIKNKNPGVLIEALIPDFSGNKSFIKKVVDTKPKVIGHNLETVKKLTPLIRDRRFSYEKSLNVLRTVKELDRKIYTKSGIMLGLGEEKDQVIQTLQDLRDAQVDIVTLGQYLQPTRRHHPVQKYYTPQEFEFFKKFAEDMGIRYVISGPLVRSSYHAEEIFLE
ncbi:lipoyl synthase [candidate division WOR-3 bacterium 4484_100]|uniref:Lipoyl synthase n=1 Tax=candidate division WOR-3 bacterium 4484_100 TaxID=1936077 RepID=A0A1V4QGB1_UNCW3|nr:MAG: lipoyl synthase [candidate division WOR-3 bacterium 4484_100]